MRQAQKQRLRRFLKLIDAWLFALLREYVTAINYLSPCPSQHRYVEKVNGTTALIPSAPAELDTGPGHGPQQRTKSMREAHVS